MGMDMDYGHTKAKFLILCGPNSNPKWIMGCGYKGLVFCRNSGWIMENMNKGLKMGADSLSENTPNVPEFICPIFCPSPKGFGFQWRKAS